MKHLFFLLITTGLALVASQASAQTKVTRVPSPPYRHYEDVRRYNAAPNQFAYRGAKASKSTYSKNHSHSDTAPVKLRTEIVSQRDHQIASYDASGCRICQHVTITIYKDIYSNGGCRLWQHISS